MVLDERGRHGGDGEGHGPDAPTRLQVELTGLPAPDQPCAVPYVPRCQEHAPSPDFDREGRQFPSHLAPEPQGTVLRTERPARERHGRLDLAGPVAEDQARSIRLEPKPGEMGVAAEQPVWTARADRPRADRAPGKLLARRDPVPAGARVEAGCSGWAHPCPRRGKPTGGRPGRPEKIRPLLTRCRYASGQRKGRDRRTRRPRRPWPRTRRGHTPESRKRGRRATGRCPGSTHGTTRPTNGTHRCSCRPRRHPCRRLRDHAPRHPARALDLDFPPGQGCGRGQLLSRGTDAVPRSRPGVQT